MRGIAWVVGWVVCAAWLSASASGQTVTVGDAWPDAQAVLGGFGGVQVVDAADPDTRQRTAVYRLPNRGAVCVWTERLPLDTMAPGVVPPPPVEVVDAVQAGWVRADPTTGVPRFTPGGGRLLDQPGDALDLATVPGPVSSPWTAVVLGGVLAAIVAGVIVGRRRNARAASVATATAAEPAAPADAESDGSSASA